MPYGYTVQWRVDGNPTWNNALVIRHAETERQLSTRILGLQHATAYLMRVVPFIIDGGDQYDGRPSREFGLYKTAMGKLLSYHSMQRKLSFAMHGCQESAA